MIRSRGRWLLDEHGRALLLRGVNLRGSSKVPSVPDGATHRRERLLDHRHVSFVGRPFPLEAADEHFRRLRSWGFTFVRLLVTWEAVEHAGPGIYDEAFLDYIQAVAVAAQTHGISLMIDPHQDMWSRFSGGDGAPGWTLEAAGFDLAHLDVTGAAVTHQHHGDPMPRVLWVTNGGKLAAATMFTLFFGGSDFAPRTTVDGRPVQDFLQAHYIAAFARVAERLRGLPNVAGFGTMNEPLCGYIGWENLNVPCGQLTLGDGPTPFQGMLLGAGIPREVGIWAMRTASIRRAGTRLLNRERLPAWRQGRDCVWRENGVWDLDAAGVPVLLRPGHFVTARGRGVDFAQDYLRPFLEKFVTGIRAADPRALVFLEAEAGAAPPRWDTAAFPGVVFAPHWYDDLALVKNRYFSFAGIESGTHKLVFGRRAIERSFRRQLTRLKQAACERMGEVPTLLGEFGISFSMQGGKAYRSGNFRAQVKALDRSYRASESTLLSSTLWNYTADNTNERGDNWNGKDLSIFSRDQQADPADINSGGRALEAFLRPWPLATAGEPLALSFDRGRRIFRYEFRHDPEVMARTEIYVPLFQYPGGYHVQVSDGTFENNHAQQLLTYRHRLDLQTHWVRISPVKGHQP